MRPTLAISACAILPLNIPLSTLCGPCVATEIGHLYDHSALTRLLLVLLKGVLNVFSLNTDCLSKVSITDAAETGILSSLW